MKEEDYKCKVPCVVTGSRVYGPVNDRSDIDIVMKFEDARKLETMLRQGPSRGAKISVHATASQVDYQEGGGFYFWLNNMLCFNIIVAENDQELAKWEEATTWMRDQQPVSDRKDRINTFRKQFKPKTFEEGKAT